MNRTQKPHIGSITLKKMLFTLTAGASLLGALPANAKVTLPQIFTSNMVLQRDAPIPIWGKAKAGETVTVTLGDQSATVKANARGYWKTTLPKRGLGKPLTLTVKGENEIKLNNVLMGDVWLCSGQSNMEMGVKGIGKFTSKIDKTTNPKLRIFYVHNPAKIKGWKKNVKLSATPRRDFLKSSGWKVCSPQSVRNTGLWGGFSATAYFFGKELQKQLKDIPIGLIASSAGGSKIEPWTNAAGWKSIPKLAREYKKIKNLNMRKARPGIHEQWPCLYNPGIHPMTPLRIKGVIWYQGEANRKDGMLYFYRMQALINGWRQIWGEKMPFYFVQLAPFTYSRDQAKILPSIWQAQATADKKIKGAAMAVTIDIGNPKDIHPKNKPEVGRRLALLALKETYGKNLAAYSPTAASAEVKNGTVIVTFKDVAGGLKLTNGNSIREFELAGADGKFFPAKASIKGKDTVVVRSNKVANPAQVRYAWRNTPQVNLKGGTGLPVPCFKINLIAK